MGDFFRFFWNDGLLGRAVLGLLVVMVALIPLMIYSGIEEEKRWQAFKVQHGCKIVGHQQGHSSTGVGVGVTGSGNVGTVITTSSTPSKAGWLCDDGVTYWRND